MKRKIALLLPLILCLITELFPTGAAFTVKYCGTNPLDTNRGYMEFYRRSFFDPFPIFWNGNFLPFSAGLLTIATLILTIIFLVKGKKALLAAIAVCAFAAALCTLIFALAEIKTVFYGVFSPDKFNWYGVFISFLLIFAGINAVVKKQNSLLTRKNKSATINLTE